MNTLVSPAMAAGGPAPSHAIQASGVPAALSDEALARESEIAQRAIRQRKQLIIWLRVAVLVLVLGGWEVAARMKWIDPFF